jgi:mono/diheme cytochrome c family protein
MGGWAVVTVKELPEYFVAGRQYTIEFEVRQHGRTLLSGLQPELIVTLPGGRKETIAAVPRAARGAGAYAATFNAPSSGPVSLTIKSGWGSSELNLFPQTVVAAGTTRPAMAVADRGRVLFVAKGCTICHANSDLGDDNNHLTVGPELGGRRLARQYVFQKIKNPASEKMPDLGLSDADAAAIAAFLSGERGAATGAGSR